jgi:hypothetical protein
MPAADELVANLLRQTGRRSMSELALAPYQEDAPAPEPEPDTWWGGFTKGLNREFGRTPAQMLDAATIRPRETRAETLAQFLPYLLPTAPGTTSAGALVKNLRSRTAPTAFQRAAPAVEDTVQALPPPTAPPAASSEYFNISRPMTDAEVNAAVAARRAARTPPLSEVVPEIVPSGDYPPSAGLTETGPVTPWDQVPKGRRR